MSSQQFSFLRDTANNIPDATDMRFAIVVAEWNGDITNKLLEGAVETLKQHGVAESNISVRFVPGSFELIFGCTQVINYGLVDAVIAIGCVIKGDTPHFDYICAGTTSGLASLNEKSSIPVINGLLTVNSKEQAEERAGGIVGNKGREFAVTAIKMADFAWQLRK